MAKTSADINATKPAHEDDLESAPIRDNFEAIKEAIKTLEDAPPGGGDGLIWGYYASAAPTGLTAAQRGATWVHSGSLSLSVWSGTAWITVI